MANLRWRKLESIVKRFENIINNMGFTVKNCTYNEERESICFEIGNLFGKR